MWADVRALCRDWNFVLLMCAFSVATGMAWTLLTVEAQIIQPCNYSDEVAGSSGAALLGAGILTSFAVGPLLQRTKAYIPIQKADMLLSAAAAVFALFVNKPDNTALVLIAWCVLGATLMPLLPITLETAAEMTFPIPADTSTAVLLITANLIGTALTFILGPLLALPVSANCSSVFTPAAAVILAFMVAGALMVLPVKSVFKRRDADALSLLSKQDGKDDGGSGHEGVLMEGGGSINAGTTTQ
jgi:MFS family permease